MIISRTPLRISFVGGGTDMEYFYRKEAGMVISAAIDKYIYIIVKKRFDKKIVLNYSKREIVNTTSEIKHQLIKASMELLGIEDSIEITSIADIPSEGSGLGSSSSFTVGLINALSNYIGKNLSQEEIARLACIVEIEICKSPIGKQDQYGASIGGLKKIIFNPDESVEVHKIKNDNKLYQNLESNIILLNTNITRSASKILKKQRDNKDDNIVNLSSIAAQVEVFENHLRKQLFDKIVNDIHQYWLKKKTLVSSNVKNDLEDIYNKMVPDFCTAGKICGAGGGGYFLFFKNKNFSNFNENFFDVKIDTLGSVIIYNNYI
tara:strand:- start:561 stop:1520 length:960 start_codon:yes stop_codon:yes gene_type:complete